MSDRFSRFNTGRVIFFLLAVITVIIVAGVLRITSSVVLPFTIAVLLCMVTQPIVRFLEKYHIPRLVSALAILLLLVGILYVMGMIIYTSGRALLSLYPRYEARARLIYIWIANVFELPYDEYISLFENIWAQADVRTQVREMTLSFTNGFLVLLSNAFLVAIFMIFILFEAVFLREKLNKAFEGRRAERIKTISTDVITQITRYLSIMFFISFLNGILAGVGLHIIGLEFAAVWGVIQFILNFIPNLGSIAAGVGATLFALIQFWPEPGPVITVALFMLAVNILCGFIIYPKVMGDRLGLSPLLLLISLLIWGWLWGFAGMILAVPMTAIIKITCENIPVLEPISIMMGSRKTVTTKTASSEDDPAGNDEPAEEAKTSMGDPHEVEKQG